MKAEIITVGDSLLLSATQPMSAGLISQRIINLGIKIGGHVTTDGGESYRQIVANAKKNNDIAIFKLDADADILTKSRIVDEWNDALSFSEKSYNDILEYAQKNGIKLDENAKDGAYVPQKGRLLRLDNSQAVAMILIDDEKLAVILQCTENDTHRLLNEKVVPFLSRLVSVAIITRYINVIGIDVASAKEKLSDIRCQNGQTISYLSKKGEISIIITAKAESREIAESALDDIYTQIDGKIHNYIYGVNANNIESALVSQLVNEGKTISVAEGMTGAGLAYRLSQTDKGDEVFSLGITAISDNDKITHLGVSADDIATYTAVSTPVVTQMARYVQKSTNTDYAIATTGWYKQSEKATDPYGTVYVAVADRNNVYVKRCEFNGEKSDIINLAEQSAFDLLRCVMNNLPADNTRVYDNDMQMPIEDDHPEKKIGFLGMLFRFVLLLIISFVIACGYLYAKNSGALDNINIPKLSVSNLTTQISNIFSKEININNVINERQVSDFFSRGFDRKTLKMFSQLKAQSPQYVKWLTFKGAKLDYPVIDDSKNKITEYELWQENSFSVNSSIAIYGLNSENSFDFTNLNKVRENSHISIYTDTLTTAQIYSVGTFSSTEFTELCNISEKSEFIIQTLARSLYDVDFAVRETDEIIALVQKSSNDEYVVIFAVVGNEGIYPSIDTKTNTIYAQWYKDKNSITDDFSIEALLYAQEVYDRNIYMPFIPNNNTVSSIINVDTADSINIESSSDFESSQSVSSLYNASSYSSSKQSSVAQSSKTSSAVSSLISSSQNSKNTVIAVSSSEGTSSMQTRSSSQISSSTAVSSAQSSQTDAQPTPPTEEILTVTMNGTVVSGPASQILSQIVAIEMTSSWNPEALKAQAIATHSYLEFLYNRGTKAPAVAGRTNPSQKVIDAVSEVSDIIMTYNGSPVNAVYTASCAGYTNPSNQVWSVTYPYLVSVESKYDYNSTGYEKTYTFSAEQLKEIIESKIDVTLDINDCENWIKIIDYTDGGYVRRMDIGGATTYNGGSRSITGYYFAYDIIAQSGKSLRSAAFTVDYDRQTQTFTFVTKGYGHGVGLSQWGAQFYATYEGWNYQQILTHYYQGVTLSKK